MLFLKRNPFFANKLGVVLCSLMAMLSLASCEDPNELGLDLVDDNVSAKFTDTLTVNVSTVLVDSIATSGTGSLLIGQYTTPITGKLNASTFFPLAVANAATIAEAATFDSLKLILPLSGYYYGDTTKAVTYNVYELNTDLKLKELPPVVPNEQPNSFFYRNPALYNTSNVSVKQDPLTSFTILPRPTRKDTLAFDMPDALGQAWFDLRKANDDRLKETSNFVSYFKGLGIKSSEGAAVLGFNATGTLVRLYYSEPAASGGSRVVKTLDFPLSNGSLQFNKFTSDFTGSPLEGIKAEKVLPASATNEVSVAQAGTGLMIKLELPYLEQLKEQLKPEFINKAVLVVEPFRGTTTTYPYPVPASVGLYETSLTNVLFTPLVIEYGDPQKPVPLTSAFLKSSATATDGRYEFSITEYLINRLKNERFTDAPLYIAPSASDFSGGVSRLVVGAQNESIKNVKLKVYYTTIQ